MCIRDRVHTDAAAEGGEVGARDFKRIHGELKFTGAQDDVGAVGLQELNNFCIH